MTALYEDQFSTAHDFPETKTERCLVIASTPRSGSHMLGHSLRETGAFGFPLEYLQPGNLAEWRRRLGVGSATEALAAIKRRRTSPNGVFGLKLHYAHLGQFEDFRAMIDALESPMFVHIHRRDLLRQAISYVRASQTGVWIDGQPGDHRAAVFDGDAIERRLREIALHGAAWRHALALHGCRWLDLAFEDIRGDIPGAVARIAAFAGVAVDPARLPLAAATRAQAGPGPDHWIERFLAERRGAPLGDLAPGGARPFRRRLRRLLGRLGP
jgi:LPS sulfotransferase NodH